MNDSTTNIYQLKELVELFIQERNWRQFHNPKDMAIALSLEAAELLEHFLWTPHEKIDELFLSKRNDIEDEVADIATCLFAFCAENNIDLTQALTKKMAKNRAKYPVEKAFNSSKKYTDYTD